MNPRRLHSATIFSISGGWAFSVIAGGLWHEGFARVKTRPRFATSKTRSGPLRGGTLEKELAVGSWDRHGSSRPSVTSLSYEMTIASPVSILPVRSAASFAVLEKAMKTRVLSLTVSIKALTQTLVSTRRHPHYGDICCARALLFHAGQDGKPSTKP